jgi:hypothetical protein
VHHDLHSFCIFLHDILDELLRDSGLVLQCAHQVISADCAAKVARVFADGDLYGEGGGGGCGVEEAEAVGAVVLGGEGAGVPDVVEGGRVDGDGALFELEGDLAVALEVDLDQGVLGWVAAGVRMSSERQKSWLGSISLWRKMARVWGAERRSSSRGRRVMLSEVL